MKSYFKKARLPMIALLIVIALCILVRCGNIENDGNVIKTSSANQRLTVIVDAGHGGADGGAVSLSDVKESVVNLNIAKRLDLILGFFGTHVVMTRSSENIDYSENSDTIREKKSEDQNRRLKLINGTENDVLLSIHQNTYPDSGPHGAQVLFAPTNGSKEFAVSMQQLLTGALDPMNKRTATEVPDNILLMNHIKCPALLVECGFLSNAEEEKMLLTDSYQLKIAAVIAAGYLYNRDQLVNIIFGGVNEGKDSVLLHGLRQ